MTRPVDRPLPELGRVMTRVYGDATCHTCTVSSIPAPRLIGAAIGVAAFALFSDDEGVVLCPFRRLTDGYCPLCGATRAVGRLIQGDIDAAWDRHPAAVLLVAQLPLLLWLTRRRVAPDQRTATDFFDRLVTANLIAATVIWLARLASHDIPTPFGI